MFQHGPHSADIDFGFAAARDAVQQKGGVTAFAQGREQRVKRIGLRGGQGEIVYLRQFHARQRVAAHLFNRNRDEAAFFQCANGRGGSVGGFDEFGEGQRAARFDERSDEALLHVREFTRGGGLFFACQFQQAHHFTTFGFSP